MIHQGPCGKMPRIDESAYIHPSAVIIGNVHIGKDVFIGPNASLRADERGSEIIIGDGSNIQDNVVMHCLENTSAVIGRCNSFAHNAIVHGPCRTGEACFVGFGSILFDCTLGRECVVMHQCFVENINCNDQSLIQSGTIIRSDADEHKVHPLDEESVNFSEKVLRVNQDLVKRYKKIQPTQ
ncbi:MAG: carbonate dehydratase [Phycisphaerae bacterium]